MEIEIKETGSDAEVEGVQQNGAEQKKDPTERSSEGHGVLGLGALVLFGASVSTCSTVNDIKSRQSGLSYEVRDIQDKLDPVNVATGKAIKYWLQASPEERERRDNAVFRMVKSGTIGIEEYAWIRATTEIRDRLQRLDELVGKDK